MLKLDNIGNIIEEEINFTNQNRDLFVRFIASL